MVVLLIDFFVQLQMAQGLLCRDVNNVDAATPASAAPKM
jgi:hypothetical protein